MKPGAQAMDQGCWVVEFWDSGRETNNSASRIGGSDGGPGGLRGSDSGISDSDGKSKLVAEQWLERWSWSLDGEFRKSIAGGSGGAIGSSS